MNQYAIVTIVIPYHQQVVAVAVAGSLRWTVVPTIIIICKNDIIISLPPLSLSLFILFMDNNYYVLTRVHSYSC